MSFLLHLLLTLHLLLLPSVACCHILLLHILCTGAVLPFRHCTHTKPDKKCKLKVVLLLFKCMYVCACVCCLYICRVKLVFSNIYNGKDSHLRLLFFLWPTCVYFIFALSPSLFISPQFPYSFFLFPRSLFSPFPL